MGWTVISIAEVNFNKNTLDDEQLRLLEELLRKKENVDNLSIHSKGISFYVWGRNKTDYKLLDEIKDMLLSWGFKDFEISAHEYARSGNNYLYPSSVKKAAKN